MSSVLHVNDKNFEAEVINSTVPVLVDFAAVWCGPCKNLKPVLEQMAKDWNGKMKFTAVDIDEAPATAMNYQIMAVPTMIVFKGGREVGRIPGFRKRAELETILNPLL